MESSSVVYVANYMLDLKQRHRATGCIPTACEWLVRNCGITGEAVDSIQDDCDLGTAPMGPTRNNFKSVTDRVRTHLGIDSPAFRIEGDDDKVITGSQKVSRIKALIDRNCPPVIPVRTCAFHAVPVVGYDDANSEFVVVLMAGDASLETRITYDSVRDQQDRQCGGQEILYAVCCPSTAADRVA